MIYKVKDFDLLATSIVPNNYYFCTDTKCLYKDTKSGRFRISVDFINTELDRVHNVRPENGKQYYVYETNELWIYNSGWVQLEGTTTLSNGYYYDNGAITETYDVSEILDNNGLLADGSVCVRDFNRIIKGKIAIDQQTNNMVFTSFLGGGLTFLPSGDAGQQGTLNILASNTYTGDFDQNGLPVTTGNKGQMTFYGQIYMVDEAGRKYKVLAEEVTE